jgi:acyl carrier protein
MIKIDEFVAKFQEQYIDAEEFKMGPQTEFRKVGTWDSLTGMAVLVMITDEFNVDFPEDKFKACKTVQEVYDSVIDNLQ